MIEPASTDRPTLYAKACDKPLNEQINVVAEFYAHNIHPQRIAYRTGVSLTLVTQLVTGESHPKLFKALLAKHKRSRRDQRLKQSLRNKGIAQSALQDQIEQEYKDSIK
ncbi:MAG: hypothetical protein WCY88_06060 [Spongiibacteraceae bacterium]